MSAELSALAPVRPFAPRPIGQSESANAKTPAEPATAPILAAMFREKSDQEIGGRTRTRTWDPLIKSQLLYQLSYAPGLRSRPGRESARRVAGACRAVQRPNATPATKRKSRRAGTRRLPVRRRSCRGAGSATAAASLWTVTGAARPSDQIPRGHRRSGADPSDAGRRRRRDDAGRGSSARGRPYARPPSRDSMANRRFWLSSRLL